MSRKLNHAQANVDEIVIPVEPPKPPIRSPRGRLVADMFGITRFLPEINAARRQVAGYRPLEPGQSRALLPQAGEIVLLTGPSGAGKSSMLRALRRMESRKRRWVDLAKLRLPQRPLVDCFAAAAAAAAAGEDADDAADDHAETAPTQDVLATLSRVGLAEAWSYLRTPAELSDGQRWRLRLAIVLREIGGGRDASGHAPAQTLGAGNAAVVSHQPAPSRLATLVCDEFAALLDRVTACVVARRLRRTIDEADGAACAVVATSHDDLVRALMPDLIVRCDFSKVTVVGRVRGTRVSCGRIGGSATLRPALRRRETNPTRSALI